MGEGRELSDPHSPLYLFISSIPKNPVISLPLSVCNPLMCIKIHSCKSCTVSLSLSLSFHFFPLALPSLSSPFPSLSPHRHLQLAVPSQPASSFSRPNVQTHDVFVFTWETLSDSDTRLALALLLQLSGQITHSSSAFASEPAACTCPLAIQRNRPDGAAVASLPWA